MSRRRPRIQEAAQHRRYGLTVVELQHLQRRSSPRLFHDKFTAPANACTRPQVRSCDGAVRDIRELTAAGTRSGLALERTVAMPEDQHALVFRRRF